MTATEHQSIVGTDRPRSFWLPPFGHGNGLDDSAWIPLLDVVDKVAAEEILDRLTWRGLPAYTAPVHAAHPGAFRIWVGACGYGTSVDLVLAIVPKLAASRGSPVVC